MNKYFKFIYILFITASVACDRVEYYPDKPIRFTQTNFLAHKGGGNYDEGNTYDACVYGLERMDGIEVDLQMSADKTLWLSHSPYVVGCGSFEENCFASLSDNNIRLVDTCLGPGENYTELEKVFEFIKDNYSFKYISLDVKAWYPCDLSGINIIKVLNMLAQQIIDLTAKYNLENKVMVESENGDFLYYIKSNSNFIETYLSTFGDFELGVSRALDAGFSGISFEYNDNEELTKEQIDLIHRKGLKIQLWTFSNIEDINKVKLLDPDFIQTDYLDF